MLRLFTSNRLERLVDLLADSVRHPLRFPMEKEIVVVQSKGMERWLSLELAARQGICANVAFPFPNAFINDVFRKIFGSFPENTPFDPRIMTWTVMRFLPDFLEKSGFEEVAHYLGVPPDPLKLIQLSYRMADLFDQYLLFRPEMMLRWEKSQEGGWQADLWRAITADESEPHRAAKAMDLFGAIKADTVQADGLSERVAIFGISALPRFHMDIFAAISRYCQVNLFIMNPCEGYWGDIVSEWEIKRALDQEQGRVFMPEDLHLEKGNSLLSSMGRLGRDFFSLINALNTEEQSYFEDPGQETMLACIQSDILQLRERGVGQYPRKDVAWNDASIQIHSCHNPMREIEVLHDQLLQLFEKDRRLRPRDVLVMAPDIEAYASYIQAVFDNQSEKAFPFNIADRSLRHESETIDTFFALLELFESRFQASEVLAILECGAVRAKFGLSESDLDTIRLWVVETGIRWGRDADSRGEMLLPPFPENTWQAGIERLLLGYAMAGQEERLFQGILPYDDVEGDSALILGRFVHYCTTFFDRVPMVRHPQTLKKWGEILEGVVAEFFAPDQQAENDVQMLRACLKDLAALEEVWHFEGPVGFELVQWYLTQQLKKKGYGFGFISGGITFCSMLPMRSIPFRVVCLMGMNGDAYPRESRPLGFDLMTKKPKIGDRSRRDDDRYLFLETMLSARDTFYISYVGQSVRDNTSMPPSVLVSELMDYMDQAFQTPAESAQDQVVTKHRLQAFSPEYFKKGGALFSYSEQYKTAAQQAVHRKRPGPVSFIATGLPRPDASWKEVDIASLRAFFRHPAKFILARRLGVYFEETTSVLENRECFQLTGLDKYLLENALIRYGLSGGDVRNLYDASRARGVLPHGAVGQSEFEKICRDLTPFLKRTVPYVSPGAPVSVEVNVALSGFTVTGHVSSIYPRGHVLYRYAKITPKDYLDAWLNHLVLSAEPSDRFTGSSYLIGLEAHKKEKGWVCCQFVPVPHSHEILASLLEIYWNGLVKPLHFFPRTSWEYTERSVKGGKDDREAVKSARKVWLGNAFNPGSGERNDPYFERCFRGIDPLDMEFETLAVDIFAPLIHGHQKVSS